MVMAMMCPQQFHCVTKIMISGGACQARSPVDLR
jgi:hypothetical protein